MKKSEFIKNINPLFLDGIAHRGLHNDKLTENGLKAFENAKNNHVAIELDIHLTKDNELIVCHDENLVRTTGKEGIIEDLTVEEIKENYKLKDGGEVPTLVEVFKLINEEVPIVVELKCFRKNHKALAKKALEVLNAHVKDKKNILVISFDPRALFAFGKNGYMRSLLIHKGDDYTWYFRACAESIDIEDILTKEKKYQRYHKKKFVNVWTIQNEEQVKNVAPYCDTMTFQFLEPNLIKNSIKH